MEYKSSCNVVYSCKYHVVWCPKYRRKVLVGDVAERLKDLLRHKAADMKVEIIEMEIMPDHVHLLLDVNPQFAINQAIRGMKGYTSSVLRKEYQHLKTKIPTLWTNSYFVATVGGAPLEIIKQYIENQTISQRQEVKRSASHSTSKNSSIERTSQHDSKNDP